ncbi:ThiF family adenylyltransferase [Nitratiruptor sp. YY09-18]|uniref:HesA/MoeB/ThiF family protein n=1 Tax=Nitratiruptor sp. YY09-18 TaxID=2724901 RepID=UPI0019155E17|nr:ThiF family adenylyltransferase [Nitratiruptor sp. YY09-18]BCD67740.1 molybdopterin-synthase adenylyltransferase [Nitratiruptor sp. YY09-18]
MKEYFARQIKLWGEDTQEKLQEKSVAIIGCGGLGSSLALALGSSGIGKIYLVDFDEVSVHNIHRQVTFGLKDEGKAKAQVNRCVIESRCPYVEVEAFCEDFDAFSKRDIKVDLILDATDNLPTRAKIDAYAKKTKTPWIYASVEEFRGQVCFMDKASFKAFKVTDRQPGGIAAPIVMLVASFEANLALRYLADLPIKKDQLYFLYFDSEGEFCLDKFGMPKDSDAV